MPRTNVLLSQGYHVSVTPRYLKRNYFLTHVRDRDIHAPNFRFFGEVTDVLDNNEAVQYEVRFDGY